MDVASGSNHGALTVIDGTGPGVVVPQILVLGASVLVEGDLTGDAKLDLVSLSTPVAYARAMRTPQGNEYPVTERVRPAARLWR